ncbi:4-hydroxy-tetrahydrodipicolinate reductase [Paralimibaculum aggregatum]|uniref:4-hydroxy-tetrahydrodipicolinate reductase n=1 Tax=Paralimibaculum aggregatum TaxID=3036245 RepID=A0ABQ6LRQ1_9RHOB|nr:4-hydroxy-tetrahydrodipicolinate reductase [Limibaculum sp. NKW23]GMG84913.1 4-hydroxy-tetrahydrodipicolinate reductase [Limibaculum sp. NKW23]
MNQEVPIAVVGVAGRMGRMLVDAVAEAEGARLCGVTERPGHPWVGRDLGEALGGAPIGVKVEDEPLEVFARARAVLDFTAPVATVAHAELAAQARLVHVVGTTGMAAADDARLDAAARHAVVVRAGNMSLGVNLLVELTRKVAAALGPDYDIEVVEMHHRHKVDAPSGTALMLGEAAAAGRGVELGQVADRGRDGQTGPRAKGAIGMAALRGGDVVGEHDVVFAGPGERIILRHVATDRMIFARGAVRAALWGQEQKPGLYAMRDVLGLG